MMRIIFYTAMAILATAFAILVFFGGDGYVAGLGSREFAQIAKWSALVLVLSAALAHRRLGLTEVFRTALIWLALGLILVTVYTYRDELGRIAASVRGALMPGEPTVLSVDGTVEIRRSLGGGFHVAGGVNGRPVRFIFDTGASMVVLTSEDARAAGVDVDSLSFTVPVDTANGRAMAARARLSEVSVGPIVETDVPALVARQEALRTSLLGLTFLDRLSSWRVEGDRLLLTP